MRFTISRVIAISMFFWCYTVQGQVAGLNTVLIHGFQAQHLVNPPEEQQLRLDAELYWQEFWLSKAEQVLFWSSADRLTSGIADTVKPQIIELAQQGTCANGCLFVTHSTGDLVARLILRNLRAWLLDAGLPQESVNVVATLDFAGAGGGTELADLAISVASGDNFFAGALRRVVGSFLGFDIQSDTDLGVLQDLSPSVARNLLRGASSVPRLRFVGTGSSFLSSTKPFILGEDDSVVPLHSACGAADSASLDSCHPIIRPDGSLGSDHKAPEFLLFNHFPILASSRSDHNQVIGAAPNGDIATFLSVFEVEGFDLNFSTELKQDFLGKNLLVVEEGDTRSLSEQVFINP